MVARVFKTRYFARWTRKTRLADHVLCGAIAEMEKGLIDADLGGYIVKKRIALPGRGKSGSSRVLLATNKGDRWFFIFGFEKNQQGNVSTRELVALQAYGADLLRLSPAELDNHVSSKTLQEICRALEDESVKLDLDAVHEGARDLHTAGFIDKRRMREYDALCLDPIPEYTSKKIRALRARHKLSQAVLASVLNTSLSTVRQWEIGEKHPSGPSLKLLDLLDRKGLEALI